MSTATNRFAIGVIIVAVSAVWSVMAQSSDVYVSENLRLEVRAGTNNSYRIVNYLRSGTKVELIEEADNGYSKIRTQSGKEGYVQSKYLQSNPHARILLANEKATTQKLKEALQQAESKFSELNQQNAELNAQLKTLLQKNQQLTNDFTNLKKISSNAVSLDSSNRELVKKNEMLKIEIAGLQSDNNRLSDKSDKEWFIRGAFAVVLGALLAIILPKFKPRPKNSEWR